MKTLPIVTVANRQYLAGAQFLLQSVLESYRGPDRIKFYVFHVKNHLTKNVIDAFLAYFQDMPVDVKFVTSPDIETGDTAETFRRYDAKCDDLIARYPGIWAPFKSLTFLKAWLADALPDEKEVAFIDADAFVFGDIQRLFEFERTRAIAAAYDNWPAGWTMWYNDELAGEIPFLHLNEKMGHYQGYFNTGVFIADLDRWREIGLQEKVKDLMDRYFITYAEQDALNHLLLTDKDTLPPHFNTFFSALAAFPFGARLGMIKYDTEPGRPVIVHFNGCFKPIHKKFNDYTLPDNVYGSGQKVNELPPEIAQDPIFQRYNYIKRRVMIKELFQQHLSRSPDASTWHDLSISPQTMKEIEKGILASQEYQQRGS